MLQSKQPCNYFAARGKRLILQWIRQIQRNQPPACSRSPSPSFLYCLQNLFVPVSPFDRPLRFVEQEGFLLGAFYQGHCWIAEVRYEWLDAPTGIGKCLLAGFGLCDAPTPTCGVHEYGEPEFRESADWDHLRGIR